MTIDNRTLRERFGLYNFYKHPDGTNCLEKNYYYTKYCAMAGVVVSFYEACLISKPTTVHGIIARFGRFTLPFAGMGFVFGTSLCLLGQIRKKSDVPNHVLAAVAAGTVWGLKYRCFRVGHTWAIILAMTAGFHKAYKTHPEKNIMEIRGPETNYHNPIYDWRISFYEDPGRPDSY